MLHIRDEAEFIAKLLSGDELAFEALLSEHHVGMIRMAMVFVSSHATAEELAQETWLAVIDGLARFEQRASLRSWIFAILANKAKKYAARERRSINLSALDALTAEELHNPESSRFDERGHWLRPPARWRINPEEAHAHQELMTLVAAAIEALPERQRMVITMRDVQSIDPADVSAVLGLSEGNQRVLLHRARASVRTQLEVHLKEPS